MGIIHRNEDGEIEEPCLSFDYAYVEDIWFELFCDKKRCPKMEESDEID